MVLRGPDPNIDDACPSRKLVVNREGHAIAEERCIKSMHIIRLRGPWEYKPLAHVWIGEGGVRRESVDSLPPAGRVQLPADWGATLGAEFRGRVRYERRFHLPTNLDRHERVWLVVEGIDYFGAVSLNATPLGPIVGYNHPTEFDLTGILLPRNVLTLDVELPQYASGATAPERPGRERLSGGPIGEVRLEIRP